MRHTQQGYKPVGWLLVDEKGRTIVSLDLPGYPAKLLAHPIVPPTADDNPPWDDQAGIGHGPLCPCPTCQERKRAAATKHEYDIPPDGFDDDLKF
jgi:hypothetical protein